MKAGAAWLAEYNQILDTASEHTPLEEVEANLDAFRQRLAAAPGDPVDKLEVLDGMMAAMIERLERWVHRRTFKDLQAQRNRPNDAPN